ncbi:hypothetical protein [Bacillus sp. V5-8f]|uniref:hypothetical protein n=1 Tax=Bacillus sp. V5-8f TaxID=2053044 RepID=UPI000C76E5B5|nr:hypothetical protein [Bacillus sp. V5-8f]PLT31983.1 hypothetical protein CUU64_20570 [Bacillus sp. V5-8f]
MKNEVEGLREEIEELRQQVEGRQVTTPHGEDKVTINEVRDFIKNELLSINPLLEFTNGSREYGKLTISNGKQTINRILIRTSKSFREKEGYPSGWITMNEDLVNKYELYLFVVKDFVSKLHILVVNQRDLMDWVGPKTADSNGTYHFYINFIHGRWIDDREGEYDCSRFYFDWTTVEKLLSSKG